MQNTKQDVAAPAEAQLIGERQQAKLIGLSVAFLRKDRRTDRLIPYIKVKGRILYSPSRVHQALLAFELGGPQKPPRTRRRRETAAAAAA
jgi:hypothetical protein